MTHDVLGLTSRRELLGVAAAGGLVLSGCGGGDGGREAATVDASVPRRRGGTFRLGINDASAGIDSIDAHGRGPTISGAAMVRQLFERLLAYDHRYGVQLSLAESFEPDADLRAWTARLKPGLTFHDGRPVTADDVIFSIERVLDPATKSAAARSLADVDPRQLKKLDRRTVRIGLKQPNYFLRETFAQVFMGIVPVGYDPRAPIGTGPFRFVSWDPGRLFVAERNESYWRSNRPYLDRIEIVGFADPVVARLNALKSGQIDGANTVPTSDVATLKAMRNLSVIESPRSAIDISVMRSDRGPFSDPRVRRAFKLIADRQQLVDQVYAGFGAPGNDLFSPNDPYYAADIPQRQQDLEQARSLLRQAGQEGMRITYDTAAYAPGSIAGAQVFAQQAKAAGVDVKVNTISDLTQFFTDYYGQSALQPEYYNNNAWSIIAGYAIFEDSPYNTAHWREPRLTSLYREAKGARDDARRHELMDEIQQTIHDDSGWLVWGSRTNVDAFSTRFTGIVPDVSGGFGGFDFRDVAQV